jgi:hypothetical protein
MSRNESRSWLDRNWYWAIPGGCLGCLGVVLGSCGLLVGGLFSVVRGSEPFEEAMQRSRANPAIVQALGEPIRNGWSFRGNFEFSDSKREVDMSLPISGPRGDATIRVIGRQRNGVWEYEVFEVELDADGTIVDLRADDER